MATEEPQGRARAEPRARWRSGPWTSVRRPAPPARVGTAPTARQRGLSPRGGSRRRPLALLVIVLALTGCGVRLDTPPPALPSPGADETARQGAAERATAVAALAQEAATDAAGADVAVLDRIASDARAHADALGGVWAPPDWATTAGMPTPTPSPTSGPGETAPPVAPTSTAQPAPADPSDRTGPPAAPGAADVARALAASAERTCADAVAVEPADLASLLASICLAQRRGATALGDAVPDLAGTPGAEERAAALAAADLDALALSRALDAAGFALEVAAARSAGATRDDLVERAEDHRTTAELLLEAAGVLSTDEDPRRAAYDLEDGRAEPADVESGVLAAWSAAFGDLGPAHRGTVLAEMAAAEAAAHAAGAPVATFPGLP